MRKCNWTSDNFEAVRRFSEHSRVYQASTSEMYGKIREPQQNEETPFYPESPYGVAKQFAHCMGVNYRKLWVIHKQWNSI